MKSELLVQCFVPVQKLLRWIIIFGLNCPTCSAAAHIFLQCTFSVQCETCCHHEPSHTCSICQDWVRREKQPSSTLGFMVKFGSERLMMTKLCCCLFMLVKTLCLLKESRGLSDQNQVKTKSPDWTFFTSGLCCSSFYHLTRHISVRIC